LEKPEKEREYFNTTDIWEMRKGRSLMSGKRDELVQLFRDTFFKGDTKRNPPCISEPCYRSTAALASAKFETFQLYQCPPYV